MIETAKILSRCNKPVIQNNLEYIRLQNGDDWLLKDYKLFEKLQTTEMNCILKSNQFVVIFNNLDEKKYTYYDYANASDNYCLENNIKNKFEKDLCDSEFWHYWIDREDNIKKYLNGYNCSIKLNINFVGKYSMTEIENFFEECRQKIEKPLINPIYIQLKDFIIKNIKQDLSHADEIIFDYQSLGEDKYTEFYKLINLK